MFRPPPCSTLFPYTTLFRSAIACWAMMAVWMPWKRPSSQPTSWRSEEHTSELQSRGHLVCRLLLEKKKPDNSRFPAPSCRQALNHFSLVLHIRSCRHLTHML